MGRSRAEAVEPGAALFTGNESSHRLTQAGLAPGSAPAIRGGRPGLSSLQVGAPAFLFVLKAWS